MTSQPAAQRWADQLAAWALPQDILDAAPEEPYRLDPAAFRPNRPAVVDTPSRTRALEVFAEGGSVLDVGAGAGAASLALAPPAAHITAVDVASDMLEALSAAAEEAGIDATTVLGRWPDVAGGLQPADVVVCAHVAYNVPDLGAFARALTTCARRRVVLELTAVHPWQPLNPLWRALHGLERPEGPTVEDAVAVLEEQGLAVSVERWQRPGGDADRPPEERVAHVRRRLCLPASRDAEIAALLGNLPLRPAEVATLWWPGSAG